MVFMGVKWVHIVIKKTFIIDFLSANSHYVLLFSIGFGWLGVEMG